MLKKLDDYRSIAGDETVDAIMERASALSEKHVVHINATSHGGGVAEILNSLVFLMNDAGIDTEWRLIKGPPDFFSVTKGFHNALQGGKFKLTDRRKKVYMDTTEKNAAMMKLYHDFVVVHDPQPLALIEFYKRKQPWVWRCHIDITNPNPDIWKYLSRFVRKYDRMIVSMKDYRKRVTKNRIICPSIDPLSYVNQRMTESKARGMLERRGVDTSRPVVSQVSRFDKWKDPLGVIRAYRMVRRKQDCQLVLMGNMALDDPEGIKIYDRVSRVAEGDEDIILITETNGRLVNALQKVSSVVLQKSIREGFGLTVSEALWKGTPVVGGNVGGIPLQIKDGETGYLVSSVRECADRVLRLLKDPELAGKMGEAGRQHVKENFLITRHLDDYVRLFSEFVK